MRPLSDYETLLQLGVGINVVLGGYSGYRNSFAEKVSEELSEARLRLQEMGYKPSRKRSVRNDLQEISLHLLTGDEISQFLYDVTYRHYERTYASELLDNTIPPTLVTVGFVDLAILIYASLWPKTKVSYLYIYIGLVISLLPFLVIITREIYKIHRHRKFYRTKRVKLLSSMRLRRSDWTRARQGEIAKITGYIGMQHAQFLKRGKPHPQFESGQE